MICIKRLFRVLSLETIILAFKTLLLGRGLYILGRNPRTAFDIIESLTGLLYPLKWEHPKILSYESKYEIFESPVPLIYYFSTEKLSYDKLNTLDLSDKALLFVDSNAIREHCKTPGLKELPQKLLSNLEKELQKLVGPYSSYYSARKATLTIADFDLLLENQEDTIGFDFWKVRECFFDFMRELLDGYQESYKESNILEKASLDSETAFDFLKFIKNKNTLKNPEFVQTFSKTSLLSRFIECRIHPESERQAIYYNYFDYIQREKKESPKIDALASFMLRSNKELSMETITPNHLGINNDMVSPYQGIMPILNSNYCIEPRVAEENYLRMVVEDEFLLNNPSAISKIAEEKWARINIEMLHTVWFLCLRVFMQKKVYKSYNNLVEFAYNKLIKMEDEKIHPSLDCIKNIAFLLGIFKEGKKLQFLIRKFSKTISERGQMASVYSEFILGTQVKKIEIDPNFKMIKYNDADRINSQELDAEKLNQITIKDFNEEDRDELIPIAIKSYFETNAFCSKCGTYIPEEIILAKIKRDLNKTNAVCPNGACLSEYDPTFNCLFLKQQGSKMSQESVKLLSPINLLREVKEFLSDNNPEMILNVDSNNEATKIRKTLLEYSVLP